MVAQARIINYIPATSSVNSSACPYSHTQCNANVFGIHWRLTNPTSCLFIIMINPISSVRVLKSGESACLCCITFRWSPVIEVTQHTRQHPGVVASCVASLCIDHDAVNLRPWHEGVLANRRLQGRHGIAHLFDLISMATQPRKLSHKRMIPSQKRRLLASDGLLGQHIIVQWLPGQCRRRQGVGS